MRELKFRAWYENVKRGREINGELVWGIESYYDYDPVIDNNGLLDVEAGWDIHGHSDEKYVVEQYTGLKDKNGKEIYEGDIVRFRAVYQGKDLEGVGGVSMCVLPDSDGWENDGYLCWAIDGYISLSCAGTEVIGNIHENPELLEEGE